VAIAHDTATRFPATDGPSGTNSVDTTTGDRTFSHAGAAGAKGAVVVLNCTGTTSTVTGVLYGGTAMSLDTSITDTSEAGRVEIWVLGDLTGLGGTQTVTLQGCTATGKWATCSTVTAATSLVKVHQRGSLGGATLDTTRQLTLVTTVTTMSYCGVHQGNAAPGTNVATGNTLQYQNDYGALSSMSARRTSADAAGSIVVGFNAAAASDDRCIAAVALQEYTPKTTAASIAETPAESTWTGTGTSKSTSTGGNGSGTVSWQAGDTVYVFGATAQASSTTLGTPTHAGANLPAFAAVGAAVGSGSQCWAHTWSAVATGSGSSVISETATSSADPWGIIAWVVRGSDGTGTRASDVSATKTVSLTRSDAHSLVFEIIADYAAGSATLTWTPSGQTQREATQAAGLYTVGVADWPDQGSAGATSYGVSAGFDATGPLTKIALEILGTVSAGQTGVVSAAFGGTLAAAGVDRALGQVAASFGFTAAVAGHIIEPGQAAAAFGGTIAAAGVDRALGQATNSFGFSAAASGTVGAPPVTGQVTAAFGYAAAASGQRTTHGAVAAALGFAAAATGVPRTQGTAVAAFGFTVTASGRPRIVAIVAATFGGTFTSSGVRDTHGAAVALFGGTFTASGFAGTPPVQGQAAAAFGGSFTAAGIDRVLGAALVAFGGTFTASGRPRHPGVAAVTFGYTATADGHPRIVGVAVAAFGFIAVAVSAAEPDLNPLRVTITEHPFAVTFTENTAVAYTEPASAFVYQEGG